MRVKSKAKLFYSRRAEQAELKNKLQIQRFSGDSPTSVEQDFYASVFLSNMASLVKQEADEMIAKEHSHKILKHEYTTNINILYGNLKDKLILILLVKNTRKRITMYKKLLKEITRHRNPKRPGRKFSRRNSLRANQNGLNQKSCI